MYQRGILPFNFDLKSLAQFVSDQLKQVEKAQYEPQNFIHLATLNAAPARTFDGLTVLADGTNWNPTAGGQGVYTYYAGAWHKLG